MVYVAVLYSFLSQLVVVGLQGLEALSNLVLIKHNNFIQSRIEVLVRSSYSTISNRVFFFERNPHRDLFVFVLRRTTYHHVNHKMHLHQLWWHYASTNPSFITPALLCFPPKIALCFCKITSIIGVFISLSQVYIYSHNSEGRLISASAW